MTSCTIVIFGASGDLTRRKLIPALYLLFRKSRLPENTRIVGVARTEFGHDAWRDTLAESTARYAGGEFEQQAWREFASYLYYQQGDINRPADFAALGDFLRELEESRGATRVYYLATKPQLYADAVAQLGAAGLAEDSSGDRRIVLEKPFGTTLDTARRLNRAVHRVFQERQVYRIDHYLGKETVQNLLVLRFANSIFEPLWNRNFVDHVQITVAEEVSIADRAGYYDGSGILRDMFQNHLLQLMTITAMEAPVRFEADLVRDEKVKVLRSVRPLEVDDVHQDTVRAQYDGYLQEEGVPAASGTATFAVLKLWLDNWRWKDVPFYLRSGKAMSCRTTQIVIQFRQPPHMMFEEGGRTQLWDANRLVIQLQPAEGIQLQFQTKVPDAGMKLRLTDLDFRFAETFSGSMPDAYQRLLIDAVKGDASLFARSDEVELAWGIIDPIVAAWSRSAEPPLETYPVGLWGPDAATEWMREQGREWFDVCPVLR